MGLHVTGSAADNAIHNGSSGSERIISISRWLNPSTQPPRYPASPPINSPSSRLIVTPTSPMVREIRVP